MLSEIGPEQSFQVDHNRLEIAVFGPKMSEIGDQFDEKSLVKGLIRAILSDKERVFVGFGC